MSDLVNIQIVGFLTPGLKCLFRNSNKSVKQQIKSDKISQNGVFLSQGVQRRMVLVVNVFRIFKINFFGFVIATFDVVHEMEPILHLH